MFLEPKTGINSSKASSWWLLLIWNIYDFIHPPVSADVCTFISTYILESLLNMHSDHQTTKNTGLHTNAHASNIRKPGWLTELITSVVVQLSEIFIVRLNWTDPLKITWICWTSFWVVWMSTASLLNGWIKSSILLNMFDSGRGCWFCFTSVF